MTFQLFPPTHREPLGRALQPLTGWWARHIKLERHWQVGKVRGRRSFRQASAPVIPVQSAVLDGFREVLGGDALLAGEVGDGAGDFATGAWARACSTRGRISTEDAPPSLARICLNAGATTHSKSVNQGRGLPVAVTGGAPVQRPLETLSTGNIRGGG